MIRFEGKKRTKSGTLNDFGIFENSGKSHILISHDLQKILYSNKEFNETFSEPKKEKLIHTLKSFIESNNEKEAQILDAVFSYVHIDVVEMKNGENAILCSLSHRHEMPFENYYNVLFQAEKVLNFGSWAYNPKDNILKISPGMINLLGLDTTQNTNLIPKTLDEYMEWIHPEDRGHLQEKVSDLRKTGELFELSEYRVILKNGDIRILQSTLLNSKVMKGQPLIIYGLIEDISDRKIMETEKTKYLIQLKKSNDALSEFAYTASHDLQEPLRKIEAYGNRLKKSLGKNLEENSSRYLDKLIHSTLRMSNLVDDVLTLSRLSSSKEEKQAINLNELMAEIEDDMEETIQSAKAIIKVDLPEITGSKTQWRQLLQNLIGNAIKFRDKNRQAVIEISYTNTTKLEKKDFLLKPNINYYTICVKDNGLGFDQKFENIIFSPFKRLVGHTEFPGTGIGLAICKKVVENHNGHIRVESQEGKGTAFYLYIPKN